MATTSAPRGAMPNKTTTKTVRNNRYNFLSSSCWEGDCWKSTPTRWEVISISLSLTAAASSTQTGYQIVSRERDAQKRLSRERNWCVTQLSKYFFMAAAIMASAHKKKNPSLTLTFGLREIPSSSEFKSKQTVTLAFLFRNSDSRGEKNATPLNNRNQIGINLNDNRKSDGDDEFLIAAIPRIAWHLGVTLGATTTGCVTSKLYGCNTWEFVVVLVGSAARWQFTLAIMALAIKKVLNLTVRARKSDSRCICGSVLVGDYQQKTMRGRGPRVARLSIFKMLSVFALCIFSWLRLRAIVVVKESSESTIFK